MKKFFFSLLAIAAIAACAKTEDVYTEENTEIQISPVTSVATKANIKQAIDGIAYPTAEDFDVFAYWKNEPAGSTFTTGETNYLIADDATGVEFVNKGAYWGGNTTYYWPKNGSLRFAAYSPADLDMTHVLATDTYTLSNLVYPTNTADTYEILVAPTSESYTAQTAAEKVSVVFEHTLSWLTIKLVSTDVAAGAFTVNGLIVNDVKYNGTLTANMAADTKEWDLEDATNNVFVFNRDTYAKADIADLATVTTAAKTYENVDNGFLVLPQETTTLTITYTQNPLDGTPALTGQELTIPLTLEADKPWEPGKHYTYTVIFDLDEILINPSVADWEDVVVNDTPATEVVASTEAELVAAINNGGQVRLGADIVTTENFHVYESINIDLNGYTLTANVGDEIFARVYNGATFTIGRGTVVCDDYMVSVNAGGVAVINDGVYTAETTVVNVNGGKAYITGGMFKDNSTYNGQYLINHVDAQKNNGLIEITGGSFVNFNPAAASSEYPAMNFVKTGYNVTCVGNVYTVTAADVDVTLTADTEIEATYTVAGAVLDGAGKTISVDAAASKDFITASTFRFINASATVDEPVTIKNLTIDGNNASYDGFGIRAIFLAGAGVYNIENVNITEVTYTINDDTTAKTLNVTDSVLEGWTSYNANTVATFTNVEFKKGTYATFRPQGATILTNCAFEDGFTINLDKLVNPIVFDNCTYNGAALVEANLTNVPAGLVTIQ